MQALVMELVEGDDLSQRIARGAIPIEDALPIAKQIAEALEAAHEQGIIHRDLKPANIKVRSDGTVKVLDFGLAKAMDPVAQLQLPAPAAQRLPRPGRSPTITTPAMTRLGMILGTAAYMSPEQAKGRAADKRSDVWAFGCVFYEMLAGRRAFEGEDVSDTIAAVLKSEPDWNALPSSLPNAVRALIQGCVRKDRQERIGDISDCALPSEPTAYGGDRPHRSASPSRSGSVATRGPRRCRCGDGRCCYRRGSLDAEAVADGPGDSVHLHAAAGTTGEPGSSSRRPFTGRHTHGVRSRWPAVSEGDVGVRGKDDTPERTRRCLLNPVFSPDGQSLVFWADAALKRIAIGGGAAVTICQVNPSPLDIAGATTASCFRRWEPASCGSRRPAASRRRSSA